MIPYAVFSEKEKNILRYIFSLRTTSRQELQTYTHYSSPTVYRITDDLLQKKIIIISGTEEETVKGRPTEKIGINGNAGIILCIHIERTGYTAAFVDLSLNMVGKKNHTFSEPTTPDIFIRQIQEDYGRLLEECKLSNDNILGIGMAIVGPIDYTQEKMLNPTYFQAGDWSGIPIIRMIRTCFSKHVEYNCNAGACLQGHYFRNLYRKYKNVAYITLGTGIGSGLILNRKVHIHHIVLDALAHMTIELNGKKCYCGAYGCVESYVSKHAILEDCRRALKMGQQSCMNIDTLSIANIARALTQYDMVAESVIQNAAAVFSCCLANYLRITDLEAVILGGSLIEQIPSFYNRITSFVTAKNIGKIDLICGTHEQYNTLCGIAAQYILHTILK